MVSMLRVAAIGIGVLGAPSLLAAWPGGLAAGEEAAPAAQSAPGGSPPEPAAGSTVAEPAARDGRGGASATRPPAARRRRRTIHESIEKAVDEVMRRHYDPCAAAAQRGVPCFPTGVDVEGLRYSVADAMRKYRPDGRRAEGAPITHSDMREQMGGAPLSASGGVSVDPVCTVKSLIRRISGTGKFYLYRLTDGREVRPVLTDRKIDSTAVYASNPEARYEYLGEFSGECEAISAWRRELREAVAPPPVLDAPATPAPAAEPPPDDEITIQDGASPSPDDRRPRR